MKANQLRSTAILSQIHHHSPSYIQDLSRMRTNKDCQLTNHFEELLKKAENITAKYNNPIPLKKLPVARRVFN